jgi:hypothetical protein
MNIECEKSFLLDAVLKAEKISNKNTSLPILSCILLYTQKGTLMIRATNLDIGIEITIPAKIKEEGFENKFNNDDFKNAYFHLLLKHIDSLYVPNKNKEDFKQKAEESDTILNNILEYFEITNNPNDVVGKIEIEYKFGNQFRPTRGQLQGQRICR